MSVASDIRFERATLTHAHCLAAHMREEDAAEVLASGGCTPIEALMDCLTMSGDEAWSAMIGEQVMAMFGIVPQSLVTGAAVPWLLTSALVDRYPKAFFHASRLILRGLILPKYPYLTNMVDARYEKALRWARRLGFTVHPAEPIGPCSMPFHRIEIGG
jgi:hypothetical protein